jgi:hypothetical protein
MKILHPPLWLHKFAYQKDENEKKTSTKLKIIAW